MSLELTAETRSDHAMNQLVAAEAMAEQHMLEKLTRNLTEDIAPLLPAGIRFGEADALRSRSVSLAPECRLSSQVVDFVCINSIL